MSGARETMAGGTGPDVGPGTLCDDIGDRYVVGIWKPIRWIPVIIDLFLGALQRAARHRSQRLSVDVEIPLGKQGFVEDLVRPLQIGSGRQRDRQGHNCY